MPRVDEVLATASARADDRYRLDGNCAVWIGTLSVYPLTRIGLSIVLQHRADRRRAADRRRGCSVAWPLVEQHLVGEQRHIEPVVQLLGLHLAAQTELLRGLLDLLLHAGRASASAAALACLAREAPLRSCGQAAAVHALCRLRQQLRAGRARPCRCADR